MIEHGTLFDRGNEADLRFGVEGHGWGTFTVAGLRAVEEISRPFEYDITLVRPARDGAVDLDALVDAEATLAVHGPGGWRRVHGIVAEMEEIDRTRELIAYRALLVPRLWRSLYRRRCRTFVREPLVSVIAQALENVAPGEATGAGGLTRRTDDAPGPHHAPDFDAAFRPPRASFRFSVVDDAILRFKPAYCVQYNESDLQFVSRLLEREGISYVFEHLEDECVMTITDRPGHVALANDVVTVELVTTGIGAGRVDGIHRLRAASRLRSRAVTTFDWNYWRPERRHEESSPASPDATERSLLHVEHPGRAIADDQAAHEGGARVRRERFEAERRLASGSGSARALTAGLRIRVTDAEALRETRELVVVRVETRATQLHLPGITEMDAHADGHARAYHNDFIALPAETPYRPPRATPVPVIAGVHSAKVTAEDAPPDEETHHDKLLRVRIRFPWDQRPPNGQPSSISVRVAQSWAGRGFGTVFAPRVGHEVLVAFEQGDPERPIVVGSVYNAENKPTWDEAEHQDWSGVVTDSTKGHRGSNEIRFQDAAGHERIYVHAQQSYDEVVGGTRTTTIGGEWNTEVKLNVHTVVHGNSGLRVDGQIGQLSKDWTFRGAPVINDAVTEEYRLSIGDLWQGTPPNEALRILVDASRIDLSNQNGASLGLGPRVAQLQAADEVLAYVGPLAASAIPQSRVRLVGGAAVVQGESSVALESGGRVSLTTDGGAAIDMTGDRVTITAGTLTFRAGAIRFEH